MKQYLKTTLAVSLLSVSLFASAAVINGKEDLRKLPSNYDMILAYYGRPGTKSLGILGHYSLNTLFQKVEARAKTYEKALGGTHHVTPGLDLIYELATTEPGRNGRYVLTLPEKTVLQYIHKAKEEGAVVFLDVQLGKKTPAQAVKPLLKYLKYDNVHIAVDPEFSVDNLNVRPGKKIGSITGEQVNAVQKLMSDYIKEHHIKGDKILLVHMFTENMVTHKKAVKYYERIHLIMHLDGHGSPALKVKIYNGLYTENRAAKIAGGFKVFLKQDKPLMTPRQVLGLDPVGKSRVRDMPKFISYQ